MKGNKNAEGKRSKLKYPGTCSNEIAAQAYAELSDGVAKQTAIAYWGEPAELAYRVFDAANEQFFDGIIPTPMIQLCRVMPYGRCVGLSYTGEPDRPVIDLFRSLWESPERGLCPNRYWQVAATTIHEALHFYVAHRWREQGEIWYRTSHANELWLGTIKRLTKAVGKPTDDEPHEHWPHEINRSAKELDKKLRGGVWPF